ncbi:MAG: hypothetical protein ACK4UN_13630 [Limisphaerales bacterium]
MAIEIQPYTAAHEPAVAEFNQRLAAGGCPFRFPEKSQPKWLPRAGENPLFEEYFVASEEAAVRGGYILKRQPFALNEETGEVGCVYLPLSEGAVDSKYSRVALQLLMNALRKQQRLFSLGMGGFHNPYPTMLKAAGWTLIAVPFFFRIVHPNAFLKNFTLLRRKPAGRMMLDVLAATGVGHIGIKSLRKIVSTWSPSTKSIHVEVVPNFGAWADTLWSAARESYSLAAVRDAESLNRLYDPSKEKFLRLKISRGDTVIGLAVCLDTQMTKHKQFGAMRVGSIIDCLALPDEEDVVAQSAAQFLQDRGVDIIVSNQSHKAWQRGFTAAGFFKGPSNFIFAASPKLVEAIKPFDKNKDRLHMNRGDGEGPSHL